VLKRRTTYGRFRWRAAAPSCFEWARQSHSCVPLPMKLSRNSRPTAAGWPTCPLNRGFGRRCTSGPSPARVGCGRSRTAGGWNPVWSPNGRELFYGNQNNQIMVTAYTADGDSFRAGTPRLWSETRFYSTSVFEKFDLAPDGKRFAILLAADGAGEQQAPTRVTVLLNFFDELRRRVPAGGE